MLDLINQNHNAIIVILTVIIAVAGVGYIVVTCFMIRYMRKQNEIQAKQNEIQAKQNEIQASIERPVLIAECKIRSPAYARHGHFTEIPSQNEDEGNDPSLGIGGEVVFILKNVGRTPALNVEFKIIDNKTDEFFFLRVPVKFRTILPGYQVLTHANIKNLVFTDLFQHLRNYKDIFKENSKQIDTDLLRKRHPQGWVEVSDGELRSMLVRRCADELLRDGVIRMEFEYEDGLSNKYSDVKITGYWDSQ